MPCQSRKPGPPHLARLTLRPVNLSEASRSLSEELLGLSATLGFKASPKFATGCSPTLSWQDGEAAS